ncbi:hypothetical protein RclHR1_03730010 [Rhizophagus clarus]|uniref:Uncharacterized protein n=1 Tax=Rhizophagus clarus TaxID=94130 RepID=A0A2Z6RDS3_9GLOM|nr:hypothetical protein RclHR1_03730010 [Rhizophagus clarus]GES79927.1 hypothetical protein GLOIN_2v1477584 [Rhizophagus clarus]
MCLHVAMEIRELGGNIKKVMVQGFYERKNKKEDGYISTLNDIGLWLDSKPSVNNNASSVKIMRSNDKEPPYYGLETSAIPPFK